MSTWKLNSVGAKYNTAKKNFVESEVKFDLWKKTELKVLHKSGTNDVALKFKTNSPFEIAIEHDVRPKVLSQMRPFSSSGAARACAVIRRQACHPIPLLTSRAVIAAPEIDWAVSSGESWSCGRVGRG
jgi:hypothetical protein